MAKSIFDLLGDAAGGLGHLLFGGNQPQGQAPATPQLPQQGTSLPQPYSQPQPINVAPQIAPPQPQQNIHTLLQTQQDNGQSKDSSASLPQSLVNAADFITGGGVSTIGNAIASGVSYLGDELNGKHQNQQQDIVNHINNAADLLKQANNTDDPIEKQRLTQASSGEMNVANSLRQQQQGQTQDVQTNDDPVKVAAGIASTGGAVLLPGAGKITGAVANATKDLVTPIASKIVGGAAEGGIYGAGFGASGQLQQSGIHTTPEQIAEGAVQGAGQGAALGAGASGIIEGANGLVNRTKEITSQPGYNPQAGFIKVPSTGKLTIKPKSPSVAQASAETLGISPEELQQPTTNYAEQAANVPTDKDISLAGERAAYDAIKGGASKSEAIQAHQDATGYSKSDSAQVVDKMYKAAKATISDTDLNPTANPVYNDYKKLLSAKSGDVNDAALKAQGTHDILTSKITDVVNEGKKLSSNDRNLIRETESQPVSEVAKKADNPAQFTRVSNAIRDYYDTRHALAYNSGQLGPYRSNYLKHVYDFEPNADAAPYETSLSLNPDYTKQRVYNSYAEASNAGLAPKYSDSLQDVLHDYNTSAGKIRANTFAKALNEAYPGKVAIGELPSENGRVYKQIKLFGNQGSKIALPADIADRANKLAYPEETPATSALGKAAKALGKGYDLFNRGTKQTLLGGGLFHLANTGMYAITKPVALLKHITGGEIDAIHTPSQDDFRKLSGLTTDSRSLNADFGKTSQQYDKALEKAFRQPSTAGKVVIGAKNTANITHKLTFDIGIKNFKEAAFDSATRGLDPAKASDLMQARKIAATLNDFYGGINRMMNGTVSPRLFKVAGRLLLAPDFLEGQARAASRGFIGAGKALVGKADRADKLAAQMLVGRIVGVAATVTAYNALANPEQRNISPEALLTDFANNLLAPEIQTGNKSAAGTPQSISTPNTFVGILTQVVKPMLNGDPDPLSGVKHVINSRTAAGLRGLTGLATNQDYYGNPIIVNGDAGKTAQNLVQQFAPIPLAAASSTTKGGTQPIDVNKTLISILGGHEHADPSAPQTIASNQYYTEMNKAKASLDVNDQANFDAVHPQTKDSDGNYIVQPTVFDKSEKADIYLAHPGVLAADNQVNKNLAADGQKVDPFFTKLTPDQQKAVLEYQRMPMDGPDATNWKTQNDTWYKPFEQTRSDFFNSLPAADPNKPKLAIKPPDVTPELNTAFDGLSKIEDPSLKAKFINANPALSDYLDKYGTYVNQYRNAQGQASLRTFPKTDPSTTKYMNGYFSADKTTQKVMRTSDPQSYNNMQMYMAQVTRYGLDKEAGQDELVNPGEDQNAQPSQKYLKDVYNMGKYDIAKTANRAGGFDFSIDPNAAYAQAKAYGGGAGAGSAYAKMAAQKQQNKIIKAAAYASKAPNTSVRVMAPRKTMQIAKVIKSGVMPNKSAKGTIRIRRSMNRI